MLRRAQPPSRGSRHRERPHPGPWLLLFAVALIFRVVAAWGARTLAGSSPAPGDLDSIAWNLARGAGYTLAGPDGQGPTAIAPPLVPWLASLMFRWFGHQPLGPLLLQCAIGALAPLLVGSLGAAMFGASVGRAAAWLSAASPVLILAGHRLGTEITLGVCVLAALAASASWVKTPRPARAIGVGLLFGLATLAQSSAVLLPVFVAVWAWTPLGLTVTGGDRNRQVALMFLGFLVVIAPWALRNAIVLRAPLALSTSVGQHLLAGNNPALWSNASRRGGASSPGELPLPPAHGRAEVGRDATAMTQALSFLAAHRREWPAMAGHKLARFWWSGAFDPESGQGAAAWPRWDAMRLLDPIRLWSWFALPLALYGLARTLGSPRRWFQSMPALVILLFMALTVVFHGGLESRIPAEPLALLFTAAGLEDARRRVRTHARGFKVVEGRRASHGWE